MFFKNKEPKVLHLERYQPFFTTIDEVQHSGYETAWINADGILCQVYEYIMHGVTSDGYLKDEEGIVYPIQNILSIDWRLIESKIVLDNFYHKFEVVFSNEKVDKMIEYNGTVQ